MAALTVPPVRVTVNSALPPSVTEVVALANWMVASSSRMVSTAVRGEPRLSPTPGEVSARFTVRLPTMLVLLAIGSWTVTAVWPAAKVTG